MIAIEKLFGSSEKVKLIKLFLNNTSTVFTFKDIQEKVGKFKIEILRSDLLDLVAAEFVIRDKQKLFVAPKKKGAKMTTKEVIIYKFNKNYLHAEKVSALVFDFENIDRKYVLEKLKAIGGRPKLVILSGIFIGSKKSKTDIFCVIEGVKKNVAEKVALELSNEIGKPLEVAILDLEEFNYRFKMYDKFVHGVIDGDHERLLDKLKI